MTNVLVPQPRFSKRAIFKFQQTLAQKSDSELILIGDSLISNLCFFPDVWEKYLLNHRPLNLGIGGDKVENVLWRIQNIDFPKTATHIFIMCGSNNLDTNTPEDIAQGIMHCGTSIKLQSIQYTVSILSILPRDRIHNERRRKIFAVNNIL